MNKLLDNIARGILRFFRNKNLKYGVNSIIVTAIVVALAIVLNLLVGIPQITFDLTPDQIYSIGDVTKELLGGLERDIEIVCLFDKLQPPSSAYPQISSAATGDVIQMLETYDSYDRVQVTYVDPDTNPGFVREIDPDGTLTLAKGNFVVRREGKAKRLQLADLFEVATNEQTYEMYVAGMKAEEAFSGAIQYVAAERTPIVYFVSGHQELELAEFSMLNNYLLNNNYLVQSINLSEVAAVPEDAEMLVFAAPKIDLAPQEIDIVSDYLRMGGGKAMFMFDYDEYAADMSNFNRVLGDNGNLAINNDKVRSDDSNYHQATDPYTILYQCNANAVFTDPMQVALSNSRSVSRLMNTKEWITQTALITTMGDAASEPIGTTQAEGQGPFDIAVAVENSGGSEQSKFIVMGNASFIADAAYDLYPQFYPYNSRMFLYSLNWMLGETETLAIEPKTQRTPLLTISQTQANVIGVFLVVGLPLLIMGAGFVVFVRRRHL